jgi:citrate lyase subunit alpha/citrate CoA-transferase
LSSPAGPKIVDRVGCLSTPGETVDAVVTEAGVAVNPRREDLRERLAAAGIELKSIQQLRAHAEGLMSAPVSRTNRDEDARVVAVVEYRDGRVTDVIRQVSAAR